MVITSKKRQDVMATMNEIPDRKEAGSTAQEAMERFPMITLTLPEPLNRLMDQHVKVLKQVSMEVTEV